MAPHGQPLLRAHKELGQVLLLPQLGQVLPGQEALLHGEGHLFQILAPAAQGHVDIEVLPVVVAAPHVLLVQQQLLERHLSCLILRQGVGLQNEVPAPARQHQGQRQRRHQAHTGGRRPQWPPVPPGLVGQSLGTVILVDLAQRLGKFPYIHQRHPLSVKYFRSRLRSRTRRTDTTLWESPVRAAISS